MAKYLLNVVNTYRVATVEEAKQLHQDLKADGNFTVASFSYTVKEKKSKGDVVESWVVCKAKLAFTDEKQPDRFYEAHYEGIY